MVNASSEYFNPAYEKCKSIACAIRGYPIWNIFMVNMNCLKTLYSQMEKKGRISDSCKQPQHQSQSRLRQAVK